MNEKYINEKFIANRFCNDIERLVKGEEISPESPFDGMETSESKNYREAMDIAGKLTTTDYSGESKLREVTRQKIMNLFLRAHPDDEELNDDQLDMVAGGRAFHMAEESCILCECRQNAAGIEGKVCPECGHPKEFHP